MGKWKSDISSLFLHIIYLLMMFVTELSLINLIWLKIPLVIIPESLICTSHYVQQILFFPLHFYQLNKYVIVFFCFSLFTRYLNSNCSNIILSVWSIPWVKRRYILLLVIKYLLPDSVCTQVQIGKISMLQVCFNCTIVRMDSVSSSSAGLWCMQAGFSNLVSLPRADWRGHFARPFL